MKCEQYQELLALYVDEALTDQEKEQVEKHLSECKLCQDALQALYDIKNYLNHIEEAPLPEGFHAQLMEEINKEAQPASNKSWIKYISSLAAVMILAVAFMNQSAPDEIVQSAPQPESLAVMEGARGRGTDLEAAESPMMIGVVPEEWHILSADIDGLESKLTAYANEKNYSLQITYSEQERVIIFPSEVERTELTEFLGTLEEVAQILVVPGEKAELILIITENTP